ncbi:chromosome segregation protein SMC [Methanomicrobiaceae archaeon CYW5]|uniref:chromosome segregation protein SMC n=1 Tax=Methanovulcanius yangii TaxID=1789227 RepID=UPI0029CA259A|nr:chromosome segregation protein SMC [Methanovulcanius yangii]MBT8507506.1 chromosome segregation protein SMC [Methanovulcanius yangii]
MYITELEIDNFKSFGKKTKIPFYEGFTVISGPNGSGKSNIIDSILFCLALSSARGLRAEKLTDLINVNTGRNTAEVQITFSDGTRVRRRIKRTPHGYYSYNYLNDRLCKQGDIIEFLAKVGIKAEGYNVVMQGDVTRITEMTDFERRKIIDEIAGVAEFDKKKEQSLGELEVVRERIEREELLLNELSVRLVELEKEREQAIKYREWQEKLDHLRECRTVALLTARERELGSLHEIIAGHEADLGKKTAEKSELDGEIGRIQAKIAEISEEIHRKSGSEYLQLLQDIESARGEIKASEESIGRKNYEKSSNLEEVHTLYTNAKRADERIGECSNAIRDLSIDRSNLNMERAGLKADLDIVEKTLGTESDEVAGARDQLFALQNTISELKNRRSELIGERDLMIERSRLRTSEHERMNRRLVQIEREIEEKERQCAEYEALIAGLEKEKDAHSQHVSRAESTLFANRSELEKVREQIRSKERDLMRLEAQQQVSGAGGKALEAILGMDGVYGTVAQLGKAPPEYATALDIAAGGRLNYVVVETDRIAAEAIAYLKENRLGRMTFLPLNKLKAPAIPPLKNSRVIDYAVNLLEYDPLFDPVFRQVFAATVVIDRLDVARSMMGEYRMVTLEGDLVEKGGAMTGGSRRQKAGGFGVAVGDEVARLASAIAALQGELADLGSAVERYTAEAEEARRQRTAIEDEMARYRMLLEEYRKRVASLGEEQAGIIAGQEEIAGVSAGGRTLAQLEEEIAAANDEIAGVEKEIGGLKSRLGDTQIPRLSEERERLMKSLEDLDRRISNKEADLNDTQRERQHYKNRLEEFVQAREKLEVRNREIDVEIQAARATIESKTTEIAELETRQQSFSAEITRLQEIHDGHLAEIRAIDHSILEIETTMGQIRLQVGSLNDRKIAVLEEIERLREEVGEATTDLSLDEIEAGMENAERAMKRIGAVNMLAIEEYERVEKRAAERTEKKDVLSRERTMLIERIEHYEKMKFDSFMDSYTAIDENFQKIFARLTSGSGSLVLDNDDDPFAGGMTFAVQPRGKKVHLLSSLSGGEKSLTTLAFIFSIQQHMPAPFYALDEIDMMLDGSNVERVSTMIQELSGDAQSICVSLRKPTIERADRIIGVTTRPDKSTYVTGVKSNA